MCFNIETPGSAMKAHLLAVRLAKKPSLHSVTVTESEWGENTDVAEPRLTCATHPRRETV